MKKIILSIVILLLVIFRLGYYNVFDNECFKVESTVKYHIITFKKNNSIFSVNKSSDKEGFDFYCNSNFFLGNGKAIGGLVINGKTINPQLMHSGGAFIVINNQPDITFNTVKQCDYLSQSVVNLIRNKEINESILRQPHAKLKVMRLIVGINRDGEIVVIHTNPFIYSTLKDIVVVAKVYGLVNAIGLDSGTSINLRLAKGLYYHRIFALPVFIKKRSNIKEPPVYITCNFL